MATIVIKTEVSNRVEIETSPSLIGVVCADEQRHKGHDPGEVRILSWDASIR